MDLTYLLLYSRRAKLSLKSLKIPNRFYLHSNILFFVFFFHFKMFWFCLTNDLRTGCACFQAVKIINEEEEQFLKTLSRGRRLFNRTADKHQNDKIIPGIYIIHLMYTPEGNSEFRFPRVSLHETRCETKFTVYQ